MIIVDHFVATSKIHGLGVFISKPIAAGTMVWRFDLRFDTELTHEFVVALTPEDAEIIYHHAEYIEDRNIFRLGNDADIFMNHSNSPTLIDQGDVMIAKRDLKVGDELTCDYSKVCVVGYEREASRQLGSL